MDGLSLYVLLGGRNSWEEMWEPSFTRHSHKMLIHFFYVAFVKIPPAVGLDTYLKAKQSLAEGIQLTEL